MKNIQTYLLFSVMVISLSILSLACSSGSTSSEGAIELVKPVIESAPVSARNVGEKKSDENLKRKIELPLMMWEAWEAKRYSVAGGIDSAGYFKPSVKADFCAVRGDGAKLEVGTKVEVLEHAACLYSIHFIEGQKAPQYMIGMSKIKIVETGEVGWVFSPAVNKFEDSPE
ncbi:MAG: hypothetical protein FI687_06970 [SAR202 cluster bacterium]|nr:hypothetical protein [SAR202 cluster bacterium]|tara:strand:- start:21666 stop:22178 length:513 start_codon:yes stop_codon:yes gene_type:complete